MRSVLSLSLLFALALPAGAATFTVTVTSDSGAGSLRAAVTAANANGVDDTIVFDGALAGQTITLTSDDATSTALLGPTGLYASEATTLTIQGSGASGLMISGSGARRVFAVGAGATLRLENLTVTNGRAAGLMGGNGGTNGGGGGGSAGFGGGVFNRGTLQVLACTFTQNAAAGGGGGNRVSGTGNAGGGGAGLAGVGGSTTTNTPGNGGGPNGGAGGTTTGAPGGVGGGGGGSGNTAGNTTAGAGGFGGGGGGAGNPIGDAVSGDGGFGGGGGGVGGGASLNTPGAGGFAGGAGGPTSRGGGGGGAGLGGAVFNDGATVVCVNTTFSANQASGGAGGAGFNAGLPGSGRGGGVCARNGTTTLIGCTLAANTAAQGGGAVLVIGDGATATVAIQNSILADSSGAVDDAQGVAINAGTVTASGANNVIESSSGLAAVTAVTADPVLQALADNGGATQTRALGASSSALGIGQAAACAAAFPAGSGGVDQRGLARRPTCDAGAFEAQASMLVITQGSSQSAAPGEAFATPLTARASDAFGNLLQGVVVSFTPPATGASASLATSPATTNAAGEAQVTATANATEGGPYSVQAAAGALSQTFSLTNRLLRVEISGGNNQSQVAGSAFSASLEVRVTDASGVAQAGVVVTFSAPGTGASATLVGNPATTDAQGSAFVTATANATQGSYTVTATAGGGSATFSLSNQSSGGGGGYPLGASTPQKVIKLKGKDCSLGASSGAPLPWALLLTLAALGLLRRQNQLS